MTYMNRAKYPKMATKPDFGVARMRAEDKRVDQAKRKVQNTRIH